MVIYGCSSNNLCFLIHTNTCAVKSSENVTSFGIKRDCNWLDLDKVSLKLASKNLVGCIWIAESGKYKKSKKCSPLASCTL